MDGFKCPECGFQTAGIQYTGCPMCGANKLFVKMEE